MFNVSALLPDDALKLATPLTNGAINETLPHSMTIANFSGLIVVNRDILQVW